MKRDVLQVADSHTRFSLERHSGPRAFKRGAIMKANYRELIAALGAAALSLCGWASLLFELGARLHVPMAI